MHYRITDSTHIGKVPMKKLLSHNKTKVQLTEYLAREALAIGHAEIIENRLVAAWGTACEATHKNVVLMEPQKLLSIHQTPMCLFSLPEDILSSVVRQIHLWNRSKASSKQVTANCAFPRYA